MFNAVAPTWIQLGNELTLSLTTYAIYVILALVAGYVIYQNWRKNKELEGKVSRR
jgi:hypothetical protein